MSQTVRTLNLDAIRIKQEQEDAGEWFIYEDGGRFLVAFIGRDDFSRKLNRLEEMVRMQRPDLKKKDARQNYIKKLPPDIAEENGYRAMFGTIVLAWERVGEPPIEFTEENFVAVFKQVRGLGNAILEFSGERENYRKEQVEKNAGN